MNLVPDYLAIARQAIEEERQPGDTEGGLSSLTSLNSLEREKEKNTVSQEENAKEAKKAKNLSFSSLRHEEEKTLSDDCLAKKVPAASEESPTPAYFLRLTIRRWFALAVAEVDGQRPSSAKVNALYQEIIRLQDETGPAFADALIREEHRRFRWETARCGWCGRLGHDLECQSS